MPRPTPPERSLQRTAGEYAWMLVHLKPLVESVITAPRYRRHFEVIAAHVREDMRLALRSDPEVLFE